MITAHAFEEKIKKVTTKGFGSSFYKLGGTKIISAALLAYEESVAKNEAQAEQAAYIYQVIKNCNAWIRAKLGEEGDNTKARKKVILETLNEARLTLKQYPLIVQALDRHARKKANPLRPTTPLKNVYAHEGAVYRDLKAKGQFVDPGKPRFVPSATLIHEKGGDVGNTAYSRGERNFNDLSFAEFTELDRLLQGQYKVLYMSKIQRLNYLVSFEGGRFVRGDDSVVQMPGTRIELDLEGAMDQTKLYACDKYGNIFMTANDIPDKTGKIVQVNHSTLLAGADVFCAGTISIKNGILRGLSNLSGHYQPDTAALTGLLRELAVEGVDVNAVVIMDRAAGITTDGRRYLAGDLVDRANDPYVQRLKVATA